MQDVLLRCDGYRPVFNRRVPLPEVETALLHVTTVVKTVVPKILSGRRFRNLSTSRDFSFTLSRVEYPEKWYDPGPDLLFPRPSSLLCPTQEWIALVSFVPFLEENPQIRVLLRRTSTPFPPEETFQISASIQAATAAQTRESWAPPAPVFTENQGTSFIKTYLLKNANDATKEAFFTVDPDSIHFFMFLALYFYTVEPLKIEALPYFFTQKIKEKIEQLREQPPLADSSIPQSILTDFNVFNDAGDSLNHIATFKELREYSFEMMQGGQPNLFMECWQNLVSDG